jgi:hypothetical protein
MRSPRFVETTQRASSSSQRKLLDPGLEADVAVQIELAGDRLAVVEDLAAVGVLLLRHVADLLEERQVGVGLDVAGDARVAVPVPGASEVRRRVDDADVFDAGLAQPCPGQEAPEAAPDHQHLDLVEERRALEAGLRVRIVEEVGELALDLDVLLVAVLAQAPVALLAVPLAQRRRVEAEVRHRLLCRLRCHRLVVALGRHATASRWFPRLLHHGCKSAILPSWPNPSPRRPDPSRAGTAPTRRIAPTSTIPTRRTADCASSIRSA